MKKVCLLLVTIVLMSCVAVNAAVGDVIGCARHTDIIATINGAQIPSYNVDGYTYIIAEDLADYGFNVVWKPDEKLIEVNRDYSDRSIYSNYKKPKISDDKIGEKAFDILETNINAALSGYHLYSFRNGELVKAYNIDGRTVIPFDMMDIFGRVEWDGDAREISLTMPGINIVGGEKENSWIVKNEFMTRAGELEMMYDEVLETAMTQRDLNSESWFCFRAWDVLLNEVYQYLRTNLSSAEFETLKQDEIRWIAQKENAMKEEEEAFRGGSVMPLMVNGVGIQYTEERCYYLISLIK